MSEQRMVMTEVGAAKAKIALNLYAKGFSPEEVFDVLDFDEIDPEKYPDVTKEKVIAVLMVTARECGVFG